jgi:hypothetical protein
MRVGRFSHAQYGGLSDYNKEVTDRLVGIEIEIEGVKKFANVIKESSTSGTGHLDWFVKKDNSLRNNGAEFVTKPIPLSSVDADVTWFYEQAKEGGWESSERTGTHVHVDCRDLTFEELRKLVTIYCLVEPMLFDYVGTEREENIFCVPWYRAYNDLDSFSTIASKYKGELGPIIEHITMCMCKYSALYLEPLKRFGSVEFRHAPTWDYGYRHRLSSWVRACTAIVNFSKSQYDSAVDLYKAWDANPVSIAQKAVGANIPVPYNYMTTVNKWECDFLAMKCSGMPFDAGWMKMGGTIGNLPKPAKEKVGKAKAKTKMFKDLYSSPSWTDFEAYVKKVQAMEAPKKSSADQALDQFAAAYTLPPLTPSPSDVEDVDDWISPDDDADE